MISCVSDVDLAPIPRNGPIVGNSVVFILRFNKREVLNPLVVNYTIRKIVRDLLAAFRIILEVIVLSTAKLVVEVREVYWLHVKIVKDRRVVIIVNR